jgi:small-conductance mechanosensitive channel
MFETLSQTRFSWAHVAVGVLGIFLALLLSRSAVGRLHRRRIFLIAGALAASILVHLLRITLEALLPGDPQPTLHVAAVLLLAFGLTGLVGLLLFDFAFQRARLTVPTILRDIAQAFAFFIILLVVLRRSGVNLLSLLTTSAVLTAVIGLALQNTIANMFAGLSLQLDRTINVGDWIQMTHWIGRITHIKWRSTFVVTRDGNNLILPNSELMRQEVLNFSKPTGVHRSTVKVGFAYRHPPREVMRVLVNALRGLPEVLAEPAPDCLPSEFGEYAIFYVLRYWTDHVENDLIVEGEVRVRIWYAARRAGLEIPYPTRTVNARLLEPAPAAPAGGSDETASRARPPAAPTTTSRAGSSTRRRCRGCCATSPRPPRTCRPSSPAASRSSPASAPICRRRGAIPPSPISACSPASATSSTCAAEAHGRAAARATRDR